MKRLFIPVILILFGISLISVQGETRADEIMKKALFLGTTEDMSGTIHMVLRDKDGTKTTRRLEMYTKKTAGGNNTFIEFLSPADVKGTRFLTIGSDDQRLWLPDLGKVRKIAASGKDGKFMGSDLSYYDMEDRAFGDSTYELTGSDSVKATKAGEKREIKCHIIKSIPKDTGTPYSHVLTWVGQDDFYIYKSEMYDKKGSKLKTVYITEVTIISGILMPVKTLVANVNGHKTLMLMDKIKINSGLKDSIFTIRNLQR